MSNHLEHHGIKGQKWGVRRANSSGPMEVTTRAKPGKMVKAKGGTGHPAHEDAVKAAISRQKAKKSTTDALSSKELQDLVLRMNLEQQYSRLKTTDPHTKSEVLKIVNRVTAAGNTVNKIHTFVNSPAGKALKLALKTQLKR
jgi:hypothetical protein